VAESLLNACKTKSFSAISKEAQNAIYNGYSVLEMIPELLSRVIKEELFSDVQRSEICIAIADSERKLIDGADEWLQLLHMLSVIAKNTPKKS